MLNFGTTTGGAGGESLWKFLGGISPDLIELDQAKGATGVYAVNPRSTAPTKQYFVIAEDAGTALMLFKLDDKINQKTFSIGMYGNDIATGGTGFSFDDSINGLAVKSILNEGVLINSSDNGTVKIEDLLSYNSKTVTAEILATGDKIGLELDSVKYRIVSYLLGLQKIAFETQNNFIQILDGSNNSVFKIEDTGAIGTNQVQTVAPVVPPLTYTKLIPVYDTGGTLIGNIPVF